MKTTRSSAAGFSDFGSGLEFMSEDGWLFQVTGGHVDVMPADERQIGLTYYVATYGNGGNAFFVAGCNKGVCIIELGGKRSTAGTPHMFCCADELDVPFLSYTQFNCEGHAVATPLDEMKLLEEDGVEKQGRVLLVPNIGETFMYRGWLVLDKGSQSREAPSRGGGLGVWGIPSPTLQAPLYTECDGIYTVQNGCKKEIFIVPYKYPDATLERWEGEYRDSPSNVLIQNGTLVGWVGPRPRATHADVIVPAPAQIVGIRSVIADSWRDGPLELINIVSAYAVSDGVSCDGSIVVCNDIITAMAVAGFDKGEHPLSKSDFPYRSVGNGVWAKNGVGCAFVEKVNNYTDKYTDQAGKMSLTLHIGAVPWQETIHPQGRTRQSCCFKIGGRQLAYAWHNQWIPLMNKCTSFVDKSVDGYVVADASNGGQRRLVIVEIESRAFCTSVPAYRRFSYVIPAGCDEVDAI